MKLSYLSVALVSTLSVATHAGSTSPWSMQLGVSSISPTNSASALAGGAFNVTAADSTNLTPAIEYSFGNNLSAELLLAIPFEHDVADTAAGKVATFKHLPPTVTLKYTVPVIDTVTAYAGVGANYTLVYDETTLGALAGTKLEADNSFGASASVGLGYRIPNSPYGLALDIRYADIKSDLTLNGASIGTLKVNPMVYGLSGTYQF